jgi:hypothetical protein
VPLDQWEIEKISLRGWKSLPAPPVEFLVCKKDA